MPMWKPVIFLGSSRDDVREMPDAVRHDIGVGLMTVQLGGTPTDFKPIPSVGSGAYEIRVRDVAGAFRADSGSEAMKSTSHKSRPKPDARLTDMRVIPGSGNIFVDLGFDEAEAQVMALRVQLMVMLRDRLQQQGYTQVEAAKRLGVTQPRVSALLKGSWKDFSLDMLLTLATRAGLKPELYLAA